MRKALAALAVLVVSTAAIATVALADGGQSSLSQIRAATAAYHDIAVAEAAGYNAPQNEPCVSAPSGTMGFHYVNQPLVFDPVLDVSRPEILVYAPTDDGGRRLVAVEYMRVALANTATGPAPWFSSNPPPLGFFTPKPSILGQAFDGPMAGHAPGMPWHYDLHVWIWRPNSSGMFTQFNPGLSC